MAHSGRNNENSNNHNGYSTKSNNANNKNDNDDVNSINNKIVIVMEMVILTQMVITMSMMNPFQWTMINIDEKETMTEFSYFSFFLEKTILNE